MTRIATTGLNRDPSGRPAKRSSLLVRVTRNCPWNHCAFCPVYKGARFSVRPEAHVIEDIDALHRHVRTLKGLADGSGTDSASGHPCLHAGPGRSRAAGLRRALNWYAGGMRAIFLQDANSLVVKPDQLVRILRHLRFRFPWVDRITSYARSHTIARISDDNLKANAHGGTESGPHWP
jgi:hypothetical protein